MRATTCARLTMAAMAFTGFTGFIAEASAQPAPAPVPPKWEVSAHVGRVVVVNPLDSLNLPTALPFLTPEEFTTVNGRRSAFIPSWAFGFGNALWRQVQTQLQAPAAAQIASLDTVMGTASARAQSGFGFGVRVSRVIAPRVRLEGSLDLGGGSVRLSKVAEAAIEETRASYETAWQTFFASAPGTFQNASVSSVATIRPSSGGQLVAIGSGSLDLPSFRRYTPFLMAGGGVLTSLGEPATVSLVSRYTARINGVALIDETDDVLLTYVRDKHLVVTMFGAGVRRQVGRHWGWRAEFRQHFSGNRLRNDVEARPTAQAGANPVAEPVFATNTVASFQLANPSNTAARSSLSDTSDTTGRTFTGGGLESRFAMTIGLFLRF